MSSTRREFLGALTAAAALPLMAAQTRGATPTLGLIFPPENYPIPPDARMLFPSGVEFIGNGVGLPGGMTVQGYEEAVPRILPRAIELAQQGKRMTFAEASAGKLYSAQAAMHVALEAVQVFGGNGYMAEHRVEQLCRDAKVLQIYAGTDEIQTSQIARSLLAGDA